MPAATTASPASSRQWRRVHCDRDRRALQSLGSPSINRAGQVGFEASLENISGEGIFRGDGGPITRIAGTRDAGDFDFVNARPVLNASRVGAFIGKRIVGDTSIDGAYAGDGGPASAIYDATAPYAGFTGNPSLDNYGQAAFLATLDNGVSELFLGSGGKVTTVVNDTAQFTSAFGFSDPSLNERGEVAFRAGINTEDPRRQFGFDQRRHLPLYRRKSLHRRAGDV